ncbi:MAG: hypothetical protein DRO87_02445 [Candidatus Thorarchaeota archaeon]|nr:MAG: hypothetical protein DRP09_08565 [Candidatus Thorarchaeota archaeon]RLI59597.1 MAG: hypothetical protein DRO87_02445 [Candidatus Thorarchaeota archaeon]
MRTGTESFLRLQHSHGVGLPMRRTQRWTSAIDIMLVVVSVASLFFAMLTWINAMQVAKEVVFLATTIALLVSLVLVVNVAVLVIMRLQRRVSDLETRVASSSETTPAESTVRVVTLTNTERRVINRLEENGGEMGQDELRRITGLSKSTLSVTLSALERKALVSREVRGRTKTVRLLESVAR